MVYYKNNYLDQIATTYFRVFTNGVSTIFFVFFVVKLVWFLQPSVMSLVFAISTAMRIAAVMLFSDAFPVPARS
jgi:hypothetical protein